MGNAAPLVSIVVPSYNHSKFIKKCIESIVTQSYHNYELFVLDDGSTDNSLEILEELKNEYGFYLESNKNQGVSKTLNRGFRELATGKYYTFCASDDYWLPDKLVKQINFMELNPSYGMVYGKALMVDPDGNIDGNITTERGMNLIGGNIFDDLILGKFHPPVNYLLRASAVKELGFYRENIWAEDFDMNLRISNKYPIGFIDDFLSAYRLSEPGTNKNLNFKTIYSHLESIEQFEYLPIYKKALKNWYYKCFLWYSPYKKGKKLALKGMVHNFDRFFTREFLIFFYNLLLKWK